MTGNDRFGVFRRARRAQEVSEGTGGALSLCHFVPSPQGQVQFVLWAQHCWGWFCWEGSWAIVNLPRVFRGAEALLAVVGTILFQQEGERNFAPSSCPVCWVMRISPPEGTCT